MAEYLLKHQSEQIKWQQTIEAIDSVQQGKTLDANTVHQWLNTWGTEQEEQPPKL